VTGLSKDLFLRASQEVYREWFERRPGASVMRRQLFELEFAPEPYLLFGDLGPCCVFISTNPGASRAFQGHPATTPDSLFEDITDYASGAAKLGAYYSRPDADIAPAARGNIAAMKRIGALLGRPRIMQIELIPWHSPSLPNKAAVFSTLERDDRLYAGYAKALRGFLDDAPVVLSWCAGTPERRAGAGIEAKARQIGLALPTANLQPLERAATGVSQALLHARTNGRVRGLFVNQGSASMPKRLTRTGHDKDTLILAALT
jgi:hypothetical protein